MKLLIVVACSGVLVASVSGFAATRRDLTEPEREALKVAASETAGIDVWLIQGDVRRAESGDTALVNVVFKPAKDSGYCLAPSALFNAESADGELVDWSPREGGNVQYRFWFQECQVADPHSPIVLRQYVDISILEQVRAKSSQIVGDAVRCLSAERQYDIPISNHKLRSVDIRFDPEHGAIYNLDYSGTTCRGLHIDVVVRSDNVRVVRTKEWLC